MTDKDLAITFDTCCTQIGLLGRGPPSHTISSSLVYLAFLVVVFFVPLSLLVCPILLTVLNSHQRRYAAPKNHVSQGENGIGSVVDPMPKLCIHPDCVRVGIRESSKRRRILASTADVVPNCPPSLGRRRVALH